jgi:uncharacterized membrane protein YgcG
MKISLALLLAIIPLATGTVVAKKPASARSSSEAAGSSNTVVNWPLEISGPEGTAVVYQPQPDSFKDDKITARVAVSAQLKNAKAPVFGAAWINARVSIDRDARTVTVIDVDVPKVKFPNATPEQEKAFGDLVANYLTQMRASFPLEVLTASLAVAERDKINANNLKNDPPKFIFATSPTVLVTIDGEPQLRPLENSPVMRVVNTPFALFFDRDAKKYYLRTGNDWMSASDLSGEWKIDKDAPAGVKAAIPKETAEAPASKAENQEPTILISKEPAELIVTEGDMQFTPLPDNELLYVSNTDSDVFLEVESGNYFILSAGRWYSASSTDGPWAFVPPDKVPAAFAHIPSGSAKANVLVNVAGTPEADDAVLDASIPQTQDIDPNAKVDLKVDYDGDPKFEDIENTSLQSGINTPRQVIKSGNKYYCCEQAVWYEADDAKGPWKICVSVPKEIYTIPPSNPNYNVTYVRVYDATPTVVRVGYLPGYVGSYVYGGTVVFGTGYVYRSWLGAYYYPRPVTWGVRVVYNPWSGGWAYAPAYSPWYGAAFAASRVYWGGVYAGWWGPNGYRYYGNTYKYKYTYNYNVNVNRPPGYRPPASQLPSGGNGTQLPSRGNATALPANRPGFAEGGRRPGSDNIYNRPENGPIRGGGERPTQLPADRTRPGSGASQLPADRTRPVHGASQLPADRTRPAQGASQLPANKDRLSQGQVSTRPAKRPNDVLADKSGNIYRKSGNEWQQRNNNGWSKPGGGQGTSDFAKNRSQLERENFSRERGQQTQRQQSVNRGSSGSSGGRGSGAGGGRVSGGGGRRR